MYALVDSDPDGLEILSVYRFGGQKDRVRTFLS
jgi:hypothetical protein